MWSTAYVLGSKKVRWSVCTVSATKESLVKERCTYCDASVVQCPGVLLSCVQQRQPLACMNWALDIIERATSGCRLRQHYTTAMPTRRTKHVQANGKQQLDQLTTTAQHGTACCEHCAGPQTPPAGSQTDTPQRSTPGDRKHGSPTCDGARSALLPCCTACTACTAWCVTADAWHHCPRKHLWQPPCTAPNQTPHPSLLPVLSVRAAPSCHPAALWCSS